MLENTNFSTPIVPRPATPEEMREYGILPVEKEIQPINDYQQRLQINYPQIKPEINFMDFSNFENAWKTADMISKARCVPKEFQGNPADILVAIQYGHDLGLKPMQSLQNIMIVNNRPSVYGDALLAICMSAPGFIDCIETYDEETKTATCTMKRKGRRDVTKKFSKEMAEVAGLWNKRGQTGAPSAWVTNPERMLQHRARGFAAKDMFPDMLKGISIYEEMRDVEIYNAIENSHKAISNTAESIKERLRDKLNIVNNIGEI